MHFYHANTYFFSKIITNAIFWYAILISRWKTISNQLKFIFSQNFHNTTSFWNVTFRCLCTAEQSCNNVQTFTDKCNNYECEIYRLNIISHISVHKMHLNFKWYCAIYDLVQPIKILHQSVALWAKKSDIVIITWTKSIDHLVMHQEEVCSK